MLTGDRFVVGRERGTRNGGGEEDRTVREVRTRRGDYGVDKVGKL